MARPKKNLTRYQIAGVAYLRSLGVSNREIGKRFGLSDSMVSRLLAAGGLSAEYMHVPHPEFVPGDLDSQELARIQQLKFGDEASIALGERLTSVSGKGVPVSAHIIGTLTLPASDNEFYERAAIVVWQLLSRGATLIGCSWGRRLRKLVEAARHLNLISPFGAKRRPRIIPLAGETISAGFSNSASSSSLAQSLRDLLTPESSDHTSLSMVANLIPGNFTPDRLDTIRQHIRFSPSYNEIFGESREALANRLDVILTSCSKNDEPYGLGIKQTILWNDLGLGSYRDLLIGDLGGVPLFRPPRGTADEASQREFAARWTGVKAEHVGACALRATAKSKGPAGVILTTKNADRADAVIAAVKEGYVNVLVCCAALAEEIEKRLRQEASRPPRTSAPAERAPADRAA